MVVEEEAAVGVGEAMEEEAADMEAMEEEEVMAMEAMEVVVEAFLVAVEVKAGSVVDSLACLALLEDEKTRNSQNSCDIKLIPSYPNIQSVT